jgi:hypothetical protein
LRTIGRVTRRHPGTWRAWRRALLALAVVAVVVAGVAAARDAGKPEPKPRSGGAVRFGIAAGGSLQDLSPRDLARTLDGIRAAGAGWVRFDINWAVIQREGRRSYRWAPFDRVVRAARARGLRVLAGILYTPKWAWPAGAEGRPPPANLGDYVAFARKAAKRYARFGVHAYEIWNEPNLADSWSPTPDPKRYTQMLRLAYAAIKSVDPRATVISAGLAPHGSYGEADERHMNPLTFLERMYASGAHGSMDGVGWHPYTFPRGLEFFDSSAWSQMSQTVPSARSIMAANGDGAKKIWVTEFGAPTGSSGASLSEEAQAALVTAAYRTLTAASWAGPAFLFSYRDPGTADSGAPPDERFGIVRADWSKKPSYLAYQRLTKNAARR